MKILMVSVNHEHANSMYISYYNALVESADISFFGPGFSTKKELKNGLSAFVKKNGKFDAVIVDFVLVMMSLKHGKFMTMAQKYSWYRYFMSDFLIGEAFRYADDILEQASDLRCVKILLYMRDVCGIQEEWARSIREFMEQDFYLLSVGEDFMEEVEKEDAYFGKNLITNQFINLLRDYKERNISVPIPAVTPNEFFFSPLERRPYDWVVPGNMHEDHYPLRRQILENVKAAGYRIFDEFISRTMKHKDEDARVEYCRYDTVFDQYVDSGLAQSSPYLNAPVKRENIAAWRENYSISIRMSKIGYADGGNGKQFVHKFLEIPARGAVLACEGNCWLEKMGFQDGINMVIVTPNTVEEVSRSLFDNQDKMQRIAAEGQRLVIEKHTSRSRAQNIIQAIQAIQKGSFGGSFWENGMFKLVEKV